MDRRAFIKGAALVPAAALIPVDLLDARASAPKHFTYGHLEFHQVGFYGKQVQYAAVWDSSLHILPFIEWDQDGEKRCIELLTKHQPQAIVGKQYFVRIGANEVFPEVII